LPNAFSYSSMGEHISILHMRAHDDCLGLLGPGDVKERMKKRSRSVCLICTLGYGFVLGLKNIVKLQYEVMLCIPAGAHAAKVACSTFSYSLFSALMPWKRM